VDSDHVQLEVKDALSWKEVACCHRELRGPARESLGRAARPGVTEPLLGAVALAQTSALGDAILGCRVWTDPKVLEERDIVLGND
jgi:hypothetical protein